MSEATDVQEKGREKPTLCEVCGEKPFKYTCPGCNKRTCSLACVKKHKLDDHCSGVRNRTKYVSMAEYNDDVLRDDYHFLSDVACKVDSSLKGINDFPSWGAPHLVEEAKEAKRRNIPNYLSTLIREAKARNVNLITLPMGMTRQKENKTRYLYGKGYIMWFAKWILSSVNPPLSLTTRSNETDLVGETFRNSLMGVSKHLYPLVAKYRDAKLDEMVILLEKYTCYDPSTPQISAKREYYVVPANKSFRDVLSGIDLLEYPVFHVIFPSDLVKYAVVNLPLLPLAPWSPPERKRGAESAERQSEGDEKRQKTEPSL